MNLSEAFRVLHKNKDFRDLKTVIVKKKKMCIVLFCLMLESKKKIV